MQLTFQATNNRNKRAVLKAPVPYHVIHLGPATLQGVATMDHLKAVFPNSEDHIGVTFDPETDSAKLDLSTSRLTTWNGNMPMRHPITIVKGSGKFTLDIRGLKLLVSLQ